MSNTSDEMISVEAQYAILDRVELEFRFSPPSGNMQQWTYLPTTLKRPARRPYLPGYVSTRAIEELKGLGFLDEKGLLTDEGSAFYRRLRPNKN